MYYLNNLTDKMPFGKYKDVLISAIIANDPSYSGWLLTCKNVQVHDSIRQAITLQNWYAQ